MQTYLFFCNPELIELIGNVKGLNVIKLSEDNLIITKLTNEIFKDNEKLKEMFEEEFITLNDIIDFNFYITLFAKLNYISKTNEKEVNILTTDEDLEEYLSSNNIKSLIKIIKENYNNIKVGFIVEDNNNKFIEKNDLIGIYGEVEFIKEELIKLISNEKCIEEKKEKEKKEAKKEIKKPKNVKKETKKSKEAELEKTIKEAEKDYKEGRFVVETAEKHFNKLEKEAEANTDQV